MCVNDEIFKKTQISTLNLVISLKIFKTKGTIYPILHRDAHDATLKNKNQTVSENHRY